MDDQANMRFEHAGGVMLATHTTFAPSEREWSAYLAACAKAGRELKGAIVLTEGGGPTTQQRRRAVEAESARVPVAVLTRSAVARSIVTVLGWLGKPIRAYSPNELDRAFEYLNVPQSDRRILTLTLAHLKVTLAGHRSLSDLAARGAAPAGMGDLASFVIGEPLARLGPTQAG